MGEEFFERRGSVKNCNLSRVEWGDVTKPKPQSSQHPLLVAVAAAAKAGRWRLAGTILGKWIRLTPGVGIRRLNLILRSNTGLEQTNRHNVGQEKYGTYATSVLEDSATRCKDKRHYGTYLYE